MSLIYLLDTNMISEPIKEKPNKRVIERIEFCVEHIAISSSTVYELIRGVCLLMHKLQRLLNHII